jgi:uncharacterized protein with PIN domain
MDKVMEMLASINANMEKMLGRLDASHKMTAWLTDTNDNQVETKASQETMEACLECKEPASVEMKPEVADEVPLEDAARMPVGEPGKRRQDRHLAAQRRQKEQKRTQSKNGCRKDLVAPHRGTIRHAQVARRRILLTRKTWDYHAFRKNSAVACRGTTRRAKVAWQKLTEGSYEANRREFQAQLEGVKTTAQRGSIPATGGQMTRRAKVAQRNDIAIGRNHTRDKIEQGIRRLRALRKRLWARQEGRTGSKDLNGG